MPPPLRGPCPPRQRGTRGFGTKATGTLRMTRVPGRQWEMPCWELAAVGTRFGPELPKEVNLCRQPSEPRQREVGTGLVPSRGTPHRAQNGTAHAWPGMEWCDMAWPSMAWHGTA